MLGVMSGRFRGGGRRVERRARNRPRGAVELERAVLALFAGRGKPLLGSREIAKRLALLRGQMGSLQGLLRTLEKKSVLERVGGRYRMRRSDGRVEAILQQGSDGKFFAREGDRVLRLGDVGDAQPGDRIQVQVFGPEENATAEFIERAEGARETWVGTLERSRLGYALVPYRGRGEDSYRLASKHLLGAEVGERVEAEALESRSGRDRPALRVIRRLGRPGEAEADFRAVVWHRRLPVDFAKGVLAEVESLPSEIDPRALRGRRDLRDRCFITVDPESARDHDDAVFVDDSGSGPPRLWVAIADVSHFVAPGSALDRAAWARGNSVYFPGRSIPMLPERISSDLCSLRPGVDRLVLAVEMQVDGEGAVRNVRFHRAVIRSRERLSYAQAAVVLGASEASPKMSPEPEATDLGEEVDGQLRALGAVTARLAERRHAALSIDFDLPQPEVLLDDAGRARDVRRAERGPAHRAIEEAMLAANRAVAEALLRSPLAAVYRIHEQPDPKDLAELDQFYQAFGLRGRNRGGLLDRAAIALALGEAAGRPEEGLINYSTLRAMKQARYAVTCSGHFALGFDAYLHFTSPIRRYADLMVHRAVKDLLAGRPASSEGVELAERAAVRTSARERAAVEAEREMTDLARCEVMRERVGDEFRATVSGVAAHGLYITLDSPFVEGMVPVSRLSGYFDHDPARHRLVSRGSRQQYRVGDRVEVIVVSVNSERGWIDLELVGKGSDAQTRSSPKTSGAKHPGRPSGAGRGRRGRGPRPRR